LELNKRTGKQLRIPRSSKALLDIRTFVESRRSEQRVVTCAEVLEHMIQCEMIRIDGPQLDSRSRKTALRTVQKWVRWAATLL
jgi:hypothetical protein